MIRILCDRSTLQRYVDTLDRTDWAEVIRSEEVLPDDAPDQEISAYAEREGWVILTEDDDFLGFDHNRGVFLYHHIELPSPGDVADAIYVIAEVYDDHREIEEHVPDGWA